MKTKLFALMALVSLMMISCKEPPYIVAPSNNDLVKGDTLPVIVEPTPEPTPDPEGADVPEGCLNVFEARALCEKLTVGGTTAEKYYVKGWIHKLDGKNEDGITQYGNATFYISATNDGSTDEYDFEAFQVYGKNGAKIKSVEEVKVGDFVVIYGQLTKFKEGVYETVGKGAAYIYYSNNPEWGSEPVVDPTKTTPDPEGANVPEGCLNVYEAREICATLSSGSQTSETYYVKGWIHKVVSTASDVTQYGNATFYIAPTNDGTTKSTDFEAYRIKSINGAKFNSIDEFQVGDFVVIEGPLKNYSGTYETGTNAKLYYSNNPAFNQ